MKEHFFVNYKFQRLINSHSSFWRLSWNVVKYQPMSQEIQLNTSVKPNELLKHWVPYLTPLSIMDSFIYYSVKFFRQKHQEPRQTHNNNNQNQNLE